MAPEATRLAQRCSLMLESHPEEELGRSCAHMQSSWPVQDAQVWGVAHAQAERLQYFEALMLVCERLGCPTLAARFAQAAVRQVGTPSEPSCGAWFSTCSARAQLVREGRCQLPL